MSNWLLYNAAKRELCNGTFNATGLFYASLCASQPATAADPTLTTLAQVTNEIPRVNGYSPLALVTSWDVISGGMRFNFQPINWTAVGGSIAGVRFAVISAAGGTLLASFAYAADVNTPSGHLLGFAASGHGLFELS